MQVAAIVAVSAILTVLVVCVVLFLLFKYRKSRKYAKEKAKLYGNLYVKLFNQEERKNCNRRTGASTLPSVSEDGTKLCSGLVDVVPQNEQYELKQTEPSFRRTNSDTDVLSTKSYHSQSSVTTEADSHEFPLRKMSSMVSIPVSSKSASVGDDTDHSGGKLKHGKIHWKSMSNLIVATKRFGTSKHKKVVKKQRSSHSLTGTPKSFSSAQAALSVINSVDEPDEDDDVFSLISQKEPEMILSILFNDTKACLTVTVLCIDNLDKKLSEQTVYVQAYLRPRHHEKQTTQAVPGINPEFHECFYFDNVRVSDLLTSHLMLTLHKTGSSKKIGELFINMATLNMCYKETGHYRFPLITKPRSRRKSTLEKLLQFELGQLMVLLHFQPIPNRIKVMVNKALQLPKTETIPFKPDYQVTIELYSSASHIRLDTKSTSIQSGENPIWNEAFLFSLESDQLDDYYLEFTVLEKRRYKPSDAVIGHVVLGAEGTSQQAINQWKDCLLPFKLEVARWHTILPVIKYNITEED